MSVPKYVVLTKPRGETPLETISKWKTAHPGLKDTPMSYAGRLDPMAEGKLLVLIGDECKRQDSYIGLDKEYVVELVLDLKTDTGDVLGLADDRAISAGSFGKKRRSGPLGQVLPLFSEASRTSALRGEIGAHSRKYPVFSSKTVNGKPLFLYALEGTLDQIQIPEHIETIYKIKELYARTVTRDELRKQIEDSLAVVPRSDEPSKVLGADFRQDEVRVRWSELFQEIEESREFQIVKIRVACGSGAYMRTLAERIGNSLGTAALALSINRTKIGKYFQLGPTGFWSKTF